MKIRVDVPFMDKQFNNDITRQVGDIIDTDDPTFKCSAELAKERVARGFCKVIEEAVEVLEKNIEKEREEKLEEIGLKVKYQEETKAKPTKKGKKASKKK